MKLTPTPAAPYPPGPLGGFAPDPNAKNRKETETDLWEEMWVETARTEIAEQYQHQMAECCLSPRTTAPATAAKCQAATPEQRELRVGPDTCCEGDALMRGAVPVPNTDAQLSSFISIRRSFEPSVIA